MAKTIKKYSPKEKQRLMKEITKLMNKGVNQVEISKQLGIKYSTLRFWLSTAPKAKEEVKVVKTVSTFDKKMAKVVERIMKDAKALYDVCYPR